MWLIDTGTLELREFYGSNIPPYAILSHTWGRDEVTFKDWSNPGLRCSKFGYRKISMACAHAKAQGYQYLWADTNCIDKSSSAELTEAINSMFTWYRKSEVCYAYLEDITDGDITPSRWFTRGWTLQELLAPRKVAFFNKDWKYLGEKGELIDTLSVVTGIETHFLVTSDSLNGACVAAKMGWMSRRTTTREEDMAYSMLGIFGIYMPLLYGEGHNAFVRLQQEIIRQSDDQSIFCWNWRPEVPQSWGSVLAPTPSTFPGSSLLLTGDRNFGGKVSSYEITNAGLRISLPLLVTASSFLAMLDVKVPDTQGLFYCIPLNGSLKSGFFERSPWPQKPLVLPAEGYRPVTDMYISTRGGFETRDENDPEAPGPSLGLLLIFSAMYKITTIETYPKGLFDTRRSIFRLDIGQIKGGFLRLVLLDHLEAVIYFAAHRDELRQGVRWCCKMLFPKRLASMNLKRELGRMNTWSSGLQQSVMSSSEGTATVKIGHADPFDLDSGDFRPAFISVSFPKDVR